MNYILLLICLATTLACSPVTLPSSERNQLPQLAPTALHASDGGTLALKQWQSEQPKAIIVALHGYNDYSQSFELFGEAMKAKHISVVAFDHRGFGQNPNQGIWPGKQNLIEDARDAVVATRAQYPDLPIFLLGSSMGGAIAIEVVEHYPELPIDGMILNAPAIWGGGTMNPIPRALLWIAAHTTPGTTLTGEGLDILPTDNIAILKEMAKDPNIIKASRIDSVYGLVQLMNHAYQHKYSLANHHTLLLYGLKDEVVPPTPIYHLATLLPESNIHIYENGYHMLLRDKQRAKVFDDISSWVLHYAK